MVDRRKRPPLKPGEEWVWDYPRPPRVERFVGRIEVVFAGQKIADTKESLRVLETSHPPVYYIPPVDIRMEYLQPCGGHSFCEWKGIAHYYDVVVGEKRARRAAWCYPNPTSGFKEIAGYIAFYAGLMDGCYVNGERVKPQPGGFYGGWITRNIIGPFKGEEGTEGW